MSWSICLVPNYGKFLYGESWCKCLQEDERQAARILRAGETAIQMTSAASEGQPTCLSGREVGPPSERPSTRATALRDQAGLPRDPAGFPEDPAGPPMDHDVAKSPFAGLGPLPEPELGLGRNLDPDANPDPEPDPDYDSPLHTARSAAPARGGAFAASAKRLHVQAMAARAKSFSAPGAQRAGDRGSEEMRSMRKRACTGELRSLMALHVYEHNIEQMPEVLTDYKCAPVTGLALRCATRMQNLRDSIALS